MAATIPAFTGKETEALCKAAQRSGGGGRGVARGSLPVKGDGEWGWEDLRRENIKEERVRRRERNRDRERQTKRQRERPRR